MRPHALGAALFVASVSAAAWAEGGGEHGAPAEECSGSDASQGAGEACREYWESHINWFSWDYRAGREQALEHRHMPPPFAFALINFAVFAGILYRLAARPLRDFVRARHATIRRDLDEAGALRSAAEARLREYDAKLAGLEAEVERLLSAVRSDAEAEKARAIAEAEKQAQHLKEEAQAQIRIELARIRGALRAEAIEAAVAAASELLARSVNAEDQARMTERFVGELEKPGSLARGARS